MRDYLGFYMENGFPSLPKAARVEVQGRIYCDGWPRTGEGIPYYHYELIHGRFDGRFEVGWGRIRRERKRMIKALLASLIAEGRTNIQIVPVEDCGHASRGGIVCWNCQIARAYNCPTDCRYCSGEACRFIYHSVHDTGFGAHICGHDVGARHREM